MIATHTYTYIHTHLTGPIPVVRLLSIKKKTPDLRTALYSVITQRVVVKHQYYSLRNNTEECNSHLLRDGSLKSCKHRTVYRDLALNRKHAHIVVMTALHRHDLRESPCINKEIQIFYRKLWQTLDHEVTVQTTSTRNDITKHGLPLNMSGKERMANLIGKKIKTLLAKQRKLAIIIQWKENHKDIMQEEDKINVKNDSPPN